MLALEAQEVEAVLMQKRLTSRGKQAAVAALRQARLRWEAAGDAAPTPQKRTAFPGRERGVRVELSPGELSGTSSDVSVDDAAEAYLDECLISY